MRAAGERTARCNSLNRRRLRRRERERRPSSPSPPSFPLLWRCFAGAYDFIPFCTVHQVEDDGVVFFLLIDFQQLKNLCGGANLLDALRENPKEALLCMGAAVHLAKCSGYESEEGCRSVDKDLDLRGTQRVASIIPVAAPAIAHNAATDLEPGPSTTRFTGLGANQTPSEPAGLSPQQPPAPAPDAAESATTTCPAYFRWIHEDLRPWRATGITREMLDGARRYGAKFRVTVLAGRLYVARYGRCFQTRDVFTQWGILQLLRRYAGRVPDLDLMFDCQDLPIVNAGDHTPPPLFRYCGSEPTLDIAFPDWSFWGWPELNIKPWEALRREIKEANAALDWRRRTPYAYWKGNPTVGAARRELLKCNVSRERDWNARIYAQDWRTEVRDGFRGSDLAKQCTHRYKMYVEGRGWSVSEKYILACDSVALVVRPRFHDFFSRGLVPLRHYWPVRGERGQCRSIKFAVDWGNAHTGKAREIGGNASRFVQEELTMEHVYDYMLHLLSEYAGLLRYRPTVPDGAVEVTVQSMTHGRRGLEREFMVGTAVNVSGSADPCELPSPFGAEELEALRRRKVDAVRLVETWEEQ